MSSADWRDGRASRHRVVVRWSAAENRGTTPRRARAARRLPYLPFPLFPRSPSQVTPERRVRREHKAAGGGEFDPFGNFDAAAKHSRRRRRRVAPTTSSIQPPRATGASGQAHRRHRGRGEVRRAQARLGQGELPPRSRAVQEGRPRGTRRRRARRPGVRPQQRAVQRRPRRDARAQGVPRRERGRAAKNMADLEAMGRPLASGTSSPHRSRHDVLVRVREKGWRGAGVANAEGDRTTLLGRFHGRRRLVGDSAKRQAAQNTKRTLFNVKRIIGRHFSECAEEIAIMPFDVVEGDGGKPVIQVEVDEEEKTLTPRAGVRDGAREDEEDRGGGARVHHQEGGDHRARVLQRRTGGKPRTRAPSRVWTCSASSTRPPPRRSRTASTRRAPRAASRVRACARESSREAQGADHPRVRPRRAFLRRLARSTSRTACSRSLSTAGDTHLGGEDFDTARVGNTRRAVDQEERRGHLHRRRQGAAQVTHGVRTRGKRMLSSSTGATIEVRSATLINMPYTRARFEKVCEGLPALPGVRQARSGRRQDRKDEA